MFKFLQAFENKKFKERRHKNPTGGQGGYEGWKLWTSLIFWPPPLRFVFHQGKIKKMLKQRYTNYYFVIIHF